MRRSVLIIDDEADLACAVQCAFELTGWEARVANDGPAGLDAARQQRPNLILLDIMMPGMLGTEVCCELRSDPVLQEVPVVVVSARDSGEDRATAKKVGADGFVAKPFGMRDLLQYAARSISSRALPTS